MPRKPKATRPKAKTGEASTWPMVISAPRPCVLTSQAAPIRMMKTIPIQKALKFPAVRPERMLSDAPPSREEITTSRTWLDSIEVKTFTSSGMIAPARVPQVMMSDNFHQRPWPSVGISTEETANVRTIETADVSQTREVSGCSKLNSSASAKRDRAIASLMK